MTIDDVREAFLARLGDDATFKTLTGANEDDGRLYQRYQDTPVFSDTQPAYITYMVLPTGETRDGVLAPTFSLVIWFQPIYYPTAKLVRDRVTALFDQQKWSVSDSDTDGLFARVSHFSDIDDAAAATSGLAMQIRVATLHRAPAA